MSYILMGFHIISQQIQFRVNVCELQTVNFKSMVYIFVVPCDS